jgi:hypothetical protein
MEQNESFGTSFATALGDLLLAARGVVPAKVWSRRGWNGPGQFIEAQVPDKHSKMTVPYLFITTSSGDRAPWIPSSGDLFASDWYIVT